MNPNVAYGQFVDRVMNGNFFASFTLPVGARIVKVTYYHAGGSAPVATGLQIARTKMGMVPELLADQTSTDVTGVPIPVDVPITGDPVIKAGYRYFIMAGSSNANSLLMGVKIIYQ
jgi:hypothetical protein